MVRGKISVGGKSRANFWVGVCVAGIGSRIAFNRSRGRPFNQERKGLKGKEKEVETTFCEGSSRKDEISPRSRNSEAVVCPIRDGLPNSWTTSPRPKSPRTFYAVIRTASPPIVCKSPPE